MTKKIKTNNMFPILLAVAGLLASIIYILIINNVELANTAMYALTYIPLILLALVYGYGLFRLGRDKSPQYAKASIPFSFFVLFIFLYAYLNSAFYL